MNVQKRYRNKAFSDAFLAFLLQKNRFCQFLGIVLGKIIRESRPHLPACQKTSAQAHHRLLCLSIVRSTTPFCVPTTAWTHSTPGVMTFPNRVMWESTLTNASIFKMWHSSKKITRHYFFRNFRAENDLLIESVFGSLCAKKSILPIFGHTSW